MKPIYRSDVCMVTHSPSRNVSLARAGAVSAYVGGVVLFCGGKDGVSGMHDDCLVYDPSADEWSEHSTMSVQRYALGWKFSVRVFEDRLKSWPWPDSFVF